MKKILISLLLLVGIAEAENFYLGYDFLKVNYDDSGVNKEFDPTAFTWKVGYSVNEYFAVDKSLIYGELGNPLTTEPLFMSLHKDLLSSYKGN